MKSDRSAVSANLHHNLILEDRSAMNLSGVTDVDCFDERTIRLLYPTRRTRHQREKSPY